MDGLVEAPQEASREPARPPTLRRTRIVCISDTHNSTVQLPRGDVLIHAGDLTNQGSLSELRRTVAWLEAAPFECKIVVAGNHDITLDRAFYRQHGSRFHNQSPQPVDACLALLTHSPSITYLCHGTALITLQAAGGPRTRFTVFGSPRSPRDGGTWAFQYDRAGTNSAGPGDAPSPADPAGAGGKGEYVHTQEQNDVWSAIPAGTDIVVTHTPPFRHCDASAARGGNLGCEGLCRALSKTRPRLAVCGHVHEGRSVERVSWAVQGEFHEANEDVESVESVDQWQDPGHNSPKLSMVDLTSRGGKRGLVGGRETCVVNCAITATNYPHTGGKRLNKPIVVDLDLPVWEGGLA